MLNAKSKAPELNSTPAELAEQFALTCDPFAVWYFVPEDEINGMWTVNDDHGDGVFEAKSYRDAVKLSQALLYKHRDIRSDIWTIHAQAVVTLAAVNCLDEIDGVEASDELPAVRAMLRDMKAKLELLACREVSDLRETEVCHA